MVRSICCSTGFSFKTHKEEALHVSAQLVILTQTCVTTWREPRRRRTEKKICSTGCICWSARTWMISCKNACGLSTKACASGRGLSRTIAICIAPPSCWTAVLQLIQDSHCFILADCAAQYFALRYNCWNKFLILFVVSLSTQLKSMKLPMRPLSHAVSCLHHATSL